MENKIQSEYSDLTLGDKRLDARALNIIPKLSHQPDSSFPKIFEGDSAGLEGFYRFVENPYLNPQDIIAPHIDATLERCKQAEFLVVAHDSSEFVFSGNRKNMGTISNKNLPSFLGHFSLAVDLNGQEPLGVLKCFTWKRDEKYTPSALRKKGFIDKSEIYLMPNEHQRWVEGMLECSELIAKEQTLQPIHVCDSETDSYTIFSKLLSESCPFVIRGCQNRRVFGKASSLKEELLDNPVLFEREIKISKRKQRRTPEVKRLKSRDEREATLEVRAQEVTLQRPKMVQSSYPKSITLNAVYVLEKDVDENEVAVEWLLLTDQSIKTQADIEKVIDCYRCRWVIEEYFKALKTGCSYEKRQLESYESLNICLSLFIAIAWKILHLRSVARNKPMVPAEDVLSKEEIEVLSEKQKKKISTAEDCLMAVAQLGGHIKYNGPPGWMVLWKGMKTLCELVEGYKLALFKMSSKRCDQS
jgi:hypothetical protein